MHSDEKSLPGAETRLVLGDEDDGWRQPGWSWSHCWSAAAANTSLRWLRGCKSVMAAGAEDDSAVVAGAGRLGYWEALVKLPGEGKGECKRKSAPVAAARSLFIFTHVGLTQHCRVPSPGARALCFSWFLTWCYERPSCLLWKDPCSRVSAGICYRSRLLTSPGVAAAIYVCVFF